MTAAWFRPRPQGALGAAGFLVLDLPPFCMQLFGEPGIVADVDEAEGVGFGRRHVLLFYEF